MTRAVGGVGTFAAVPIYNFVVDIGNKFHLANIGFAIAIGRNFSQRYYSFAKTIFSALTYGHVFNVWRVSRKRMQKRQKELDSQK